MVSEIYFLFTLLPTLFSPGKPDINVRYRFCKKKIPVLSIISISLIVDLKYPALHSITWNPSREKKLRKLSKIREKTMSNVPNIFGLKKKDCFFFFAFAKREGKTMKKKRMGNVQKIVQVLTIQFKGTKVLSMI